MATYRLATTRFRLTVPEMLHRYIEQRAEQEGYSGQLLNLRVEFAQARAEPPGG